VCRKPVGRCGSSSAPSRSQNVQRRARPLATQGTAGPEAHRQPDKSVQRLGTLSCLRQRLLFSSTSA
jgi:hypothetical protein